MTTLTRAQKGPDPIVLQDAFWSPETTLGTVPQTGWNSRAGNVVPQWVFGGTVLTQVFNGAPVAELTPAAGTVMTMSTAGRTAQPKVLVTGQQSGDLAMDPVYRYLLRFARRAVGILPGAGVGMELRQQASAVGSSIGGANGAGFAFCADGAGGWQLLARRVIAGALTLQVPIAWPGGNDQNLVTWEMRIVPALIADARFQLLANGLVVFDQSWAVAPFADYTGAGAPYRFAPAVSAIPAGATDTLLIKSSRLIAANLVG